MTVLFDVMLNEAKHLYDDRNTIEDPSV